MHGTTRQSKAAYFSANCELLQLAILELWAIHRPTLEKHFDKIQPAVERLSVGDYVM